MNIALYRIHYGFETIYESIQSIYEWADKIIVVVSYLPWYRDSKIIYLGKETQIQHPENIEQEILRLQKYSKIEVQIEEFDSPNNQWGTLVNRYSSDIVLTLEPDMLFTKPPISIDKITAWRQIEFWKNKSWRVPQRKRIGPVMYVKPINIVTKFNNLPLNQQFKLSHDLTHNVGFCFSENLMLYKHLLSIGFSAQIGDTLPAEEWYNDKWLNWTPDTKNLEISKGFEHLIPEAIEC